MDVPSGPRDALAQPTRARLFALLGSLARPAPTEELAQRLGLHPNGIRAHLERMSADGLVVRTRERLARGRPRDRWAVSADAQPGGDPPTGYAVLSRWLVRSLAAGRGGVRDVEATGREIGRELGARAVADGDGGGGGEAGFHAVLVALGFQPQRETVSADRLVYRLRNCPYREAVRERQPLVCGLHRGLTHGLLDAVDPDTQLSAFVPHDPDAAGCVVELHGPLAAARAAR